uniref:Uncharacterized protein n=1 Tax=Setaria viridis TaxID=4556 RepID=A0A4U6VPL1_SETVI|nr:hypothetical protein SEVIR_2G081233v2 [Setaria viridis]
MQSLLAARARWRWLIGVAGLSGVRIQCCDTTSSMPPFTRVRLDLMRALDGALAACHWGRPRILSRALNGLQREEKEMQTVAPGK